MPVYVHAALHSFQHKKPKQPQDSPYTCTRPIYGNNNQMLNKKRPAEELNENNQKGLQNIVENYSIIIEPLTQKY